MTQSRRRLFSLALHLFFVFSVSDTTLADGNAHTIVLDSTGSRSEWNDAYHSVAGTFQSLNGYRISFTYRVLSLETNAAIYCVVNDATQTNKTFNFQELSGQPGDTRTVKSTFIDWDTDNYTFVLGLHNRGKILITDLTIVSDPLLKPRLIKLPSPQITWSSPANTSYYVDSVNGNDANTGKSPIAAWRTLRKVNSGRFTAGDRLLLRSTSSWAGFLTPHGSGAVGAPIVIDTYGSGPKPKLNASGQWLAGLYLSNSSYVTIKNLDISNSGRIPQPKLTGVEVIENNFGTAHDIVLDGLMVHDVTGSDLKTQGGGAGIDCTCSGDTIKSRFDGLTIENCHIVHTDRDGITMHGFWIRNAWYPSLHVLITRNLLEDIGGDGIVPYACDGAVVSHNVLRGGRKRTPDFASGIWPWSCDNTVIEYNEVSGMKGTNDAQGFDSDYNCQNSLFQYNYSHDNQGGFILICNDGSKYPPYNVGNVGTIVRYNLSVDDGNDTFNVCGPSSDTNIYNNTVYIGPGSADHAIDGGYWDGWPRGTVFTNNLFITKKTAVFDLGGMANASFLKNAFWGDFKYIPADPKALSSNPRLRNAGSKQPSAYRPAAHSPLLLAGETVSNNGGHDLLGFPVPKSGPPTIGAFQK